MINVAILGAGAIASIHADTFKMFPEECEVVAVIDLYVDKARELIKEKGLTHAVAYKDLKEAVADKRTDLVSICLPPSAHAEKAIEAMEMGCHVIVEKPMANSLEECDAMIRTSKRTGTILSAVCQNRFKTPMKRVHDIIAGEMTGKVTHAIVNSLWWRGENYYDIWWRGTWEKECGGCFTSHTVHHIDLLIWMIGMPESVTAVIKNVGHHNSEEEDVGVAILEYPDKFAQVTSSIVDYGEEQEMIFQTQKARLSIPWKTAASKAMPNGFPEDDVEYEDEVNKIYNSIPEMELEGHPALIRNVLNAINGKEELLSTGEDGRKSIEVVMAIYKSFATRSQVMLPITKDDDFYRKSTMTKRMPHFFKKEKSIENFASSKITLGRDVGK